jgi:DNA polymerase III sliding clamp (beta) subunit (PCNA family)
VAKEGKLTLVSADGFRLAVVSLDYDDGEGQALIDRDDLKGIATALKRAKRARIGFEANSSLDTQDLILDTELIRYRFLSISGSYPDWQKLIPSEFKSFAHFDTVEATRAVNSLKALSDGKSYALDLTVGNDRIVLANPDDKGLAELPADTYGELIKVRLDGGYFGEVLKACGGMVDLKLANSYSSMLFSTNGYQVVVMPMISTVAAEQAKKDKEAKAKETSAKAETQPEGKAEARQAVAEAEAIVKVSKAKTKKHGKVKEPVAVA